MAEAAAKTARKGTKRRHEEGDKKSTKVVKKKLGGKKRKKSNVGEDLALDKSKQEEFQEKVDKLPAEVDGDLKPGVIYVGHLPHGFYENELKGYFSQFGSVTRVKVPRSKKTARARGYAYIEFTSDEVAKIAAEAMDNYLMFDKLLQCHVIPPDKVGEKFKNSNKRFRKINWSEKERCQQNKMKTRKQYTKQMENLKSREGKRRSKLQKLGIAYEFPGYMPGKIAGNESESKEEKEKDENNEGSQRKSEEPPVTPQGKETEQETTDSVSELKSVD